MQHIAYTTVTLSPDPTILVVDDQQSNLDLVIRYMASAPVPYKILHANNGQVACNVALKKLPDLIIMDWDMPGMNGYDAIVFLKAQSATKEIPIIMATAQTSSEHLQQALSAGAVDYVRKPLDRVELLARVQSALALSQSMKTIQQQNIELTAQRNVLQEQNTEIAKQSAFKTQMLSIASHDLKSPLTGILGLTGLLLDMGKPSLAKEDPNRLSEENYGLLTTVEDAAKRMLNIIMDLLDTAAQDMGKITLNSKPMRLDALLELIVKEYEPRALAKSQRLVYKPTESTVYADHNRLYQVFENLISNAIKYSEYEKEIAVEIILHATTVRCGVRDQGQGLSEEDMQKLFGMYEKLSAIPTAGESSTGVGLASVKQIVELHEGRVWAESPGKGHGSTFWVEFPCLQVSA
jgi:two-component system, sensor histidine kinase and response regulator